ncbi:hypothetical protein PLESTB_001207900 [Pleodorina starrii]|uniref:Uncharacterized protein n=1 Tax=Pleodorina starrii TaxID=330485 RepID=A0A9W6BS96_9CHLO|nr:hypothetical protein PLESTM_001651300 [Pleodorina starrii]GLC57287.1 hypothetical protein PLESTB_001207900 [Pleodorina starrii]GLC71321.1 hypothetical protein PLESTF_001102800 [Pleodorina starrii]
MFGPRVSYETALEPTFCSPYNFGVNSIFLVLIPYTLVTALHDTNLELALILGTAFSGALIILGLFIRFLGGYRTWPYTFELFMLVVNAVLLGVSYPEPGVVKKYLPFISNAFYATFALLSIMITKPFTLQYVREFVPPAAGVHDSLVKSAYGTAAVWTLTFVANTLLYLIPVCRGRDSDHNNALNLVFRIILPIFFALFAAIATRMWPLALVRQLRHSTGFDGAMRKVVINPLALHGGPYGLPPPLPLPPGGPYAAGLSPRPLHVHAVAT